MESSNPMVEINSRQTLDKKEHLQRMFQQKEAPLTKVEMLNGFAPSLVMSGNKIVKYDGRMMIVWRALITTSRTILVEWDTWYLLTCLTILCFMATAISVATGNYTSIEKSDVTSRVQTLLSFVLSGHIGLTISRWDRIRHTNLGPLWGALENLVYLGHLFITGGNKLQENMIHERLIRHSRLLMMLLFLAAQQRTDMAHLHNLDLLVPEEEAYLQAVAPGQRPLVVLGWISQTFNQAASAGYFSMGEATGVQITTNLTGARGGIGGTMAVINTPLPYPYYHVVNWTLQILLAVLAVQTGLELATMHDRMKNGNGDYSYDDDDRSWPNDPKIWYLNFFLSTVTGNVIFALFTEGIMKVCDKLQNPMSEEDTSFPEFAYDIFMHNNMRAVTGGIASFPELYPELEKKPQPPPNIPPQVLSALAAATK